MLRRYSSVTLALLAACVAFGCNRDKARADAGELSPTTMPVVEQTARVNEHSAADLPAPRPNESVAVFAGGCFWCMEPAFEKLPGVSSVVSGYTGSKVRNPTYEEVSAGRTGHTEAIRVVFDPKATSYAKLLETFWHNVDPTDAGGQFCDRGSQYRPGIFVDGAAQKSAAMASKQALVDGKRLPSPIVVEITELDVFYAAERYHQDYYKTNPKRYYSYREGCGRDRRLRALWGAAAH